MLFYVEAERIRGFLDSKSKTNACKHKLYERETARITAAIAAPVISFLLSFRTVTL